MKCTLAEECPIVMLKNPKNEPNEPPLYFISNPTQKNKNTEAYRRCWWIETAQRPGCFKHLKTEGFNIKDDDKVMLLTGIVPGGYDLCAVP